MTELTPAIPVEPAGTPKIEFDSTTFNFGKLQSGQTAKHTYIFTNTGNATLTILDVKPGCGCTTAGTWDKTVAPGNTGAIPIQFNTTGYGGQVGKSVSVTCNDPARSNLVLQITGTVWKPIDVIPTMAVFNVNSETPTNETKLIKIVSNLEEPVVLSDLKSSNPAFKPELKEIKPGKEFELRITSQPPFTTPTVYGSISLKTSSTQAPLVSVSTYASVQQAIAVSPQQVLLPMRPLKTSHTATLLVRNNSTNTLEAPEISLDAPGVEVKVNPAQPGRVYTVQVKFPAGFEVPPGQKRELTIKTSHPKFPLITVPVVQMQPPAAMAGTANRLPPPTPAVPAPGTPRLLPASPVPARNSATPAPPMPGQ